ncbi:hypothetical protein E4T49_06674 [Aureobasidium sp. EXF-10728]|nr:hypothetical protein E4T49_06674 [Aureobasidium sp. EXF-10728]
MEAIKTLLPILPSLLKTSTLGTLGLHPTSPKWDHQTLITVEAIRKIFFEPGKAIAKLQKGTTKDRPVSGEIWVAKTTIPQTVEQTMTDVIFAAIRDLGDGKEEFVEPDVARVNAEWIGYRADATDKEELPHITEEEKYKFMMSEKTRTSNCTILYLHGGGYYMCGLATHRGTAGKLAKACGGRVLLIEYRLAPQTAFPGQLIDALNAYLYLLYPPKGSLHDAVPPSDIVFAGDSSGGNLAASLLQLLLHLHRTNGPEAKIPTILYHGNTVEVPLPAGMATLSAWLDITKSMPSVTENQKWDYLPTSNYDNPTSHPPHDEIWPTTPPRGDIFCNLSLLTHPLVSPLSAKDWTHAPPIFLAVGEELLTDENKIFAMRVGSQGVKVIWSQYEVMPHVFPLIFPEKKTSGRCIESLGGFARECVEGSVEGSATWIAVDGEEVAVELGQLTHLTWEYAVARMENAKLRRLRNCEADGKAIEKGLVLGSA